MIPFDPMQAALPLSPRKQAPRPAAKPAAPSTMAADTRVAAAPALSTLSPARQAALQRLSPADQQAFSTAWQAASATGRERLGKLLEGGKLAQKDTQGASLVANLAAMTSLKPPSGAPYTARTVLEQTLDHLNNPEVINQAGNTCGATTIQYMVLTQQPAEYARLVGGVMGPGKVQVQQGGDLVRVADSVEYDDTDRDDVERVMQSALMDYGGDYRGSYSNVTDRFDHKTDGFLGFLKAPLNWVFDKLGADLGLAEGMVKGLYEDILGQKARVAGDLPGGQLLAPQFMRKGVYDDVTKALKAGKPVPVDILTDDLEDKPGQQEEHILNQGDMGYSEKMLSHQVLVTKIENGRVHYRNPWGYQTSMSEAEFRSRLTDAIIPE